MANKRKNGVGSGVISLKLNTPGAHRKESHFKIIPYLSGLWINSLGVNIGIIGPVLQIN